MNLPDTYVKKMRQLLGDEFDDYLKSFEDKRMLGLRANTLKITPDKLKDLVDYELIPVKWCKEGFYYNEDIRPAKSPYYNAGLYYIQEPSAMSTGAMLPIKPGDRVLDLCAAPGGKSTQVAAKLKGEGVLVSNDISASRCRPLIKNIELNGVGNAIITNETPEKLAMRFENFFNRIIVDAPCSGEGMFRKDEGTLKNWDEEKNVVFCELQRDILKNAAKMLCEDGIIAYSTCTFAPEENEIIIDEFLNNNPEFELLEVSKETGFDSGRDDWTKSGNKELRKCGRLWPYKIQGEGHFLCLLHKKGVENPNTIEKAKFIKEKDLVEYHDFCDRYLNIKPIENLILHEKSILQVPYGIELKGLRVMRSGLYIGDIKTKRFEPSQAFAMTLKKENAKITLDLGVDSDELKRYLRGESFSVDCADGWCLVCVEGYPLGWGKVQNKRLKNKYSPSLMM